MNESCRNYRELLDDALDGRLAPSERLAFDAHVRGCGACAAEWELATSLRASLLKIGLDPAPAGLKESIAAEVRRAAAPQAVVRGPAPGARPARSRFGPPRALRAAAAVLLLVSIGWLAWEAARGPSGHFSVKSPQPESAAVPASPTAAPPAGDVARLTRTKSEVGVVWNAVPAPSDPGLGLVADALTASALSKAREIAAGGPGAIEEINRIVTAEATPEDRRRQAEVLVLLDENLAELAEVAGETPALSRLGDDADETLRVFTEPKRVVAGGRGAAGGKDDGGVAKKAAADRDADAPGAPAEKESALKVAMADAQPASDPRGPDAPGAPGVGANDPALYVVSGPAAIDRVERVLADRDLLFHRVWLRDRSGNERQRKLDDREAQYRIVEVEVPPEAFNDLVGDLESLAGLRLAPVGGTPKAGAPAPVDFSRGGAAAATPASRAEAKTATGAPAAGRAKSPPPRKLRLLLIPN